MASKPPATLANPTTMPPVKVSRCGIYYLPELPHFLGDINHEAHVGKWSGGYPIPAVGERIHVNMNGLGPATVMGYLIEEGYIGLVVRLDVFPEWYERQCLANKTVPLPMIFGCEFVRLEEKRSETNEAQV